MKYLDLFQLRYFITVAQLENMSHAAELLHVSQSALSKSIASLEAALGITLFDRNGKHIRLNASGKRFLACSRQIFQELERSVIDMRVLSGTSVQVIRLGLSGSHAAVTQCVSAFQQQHPDVQFIIRCDVDVQDNLNINDYDMLVYPEEPRFNKFTSYALTDEQYYLAVAREHPLAARPQIQLEDLCHQNYAILCRGNQDMEYSIEFPCRVCIAMNLPIYIRCFTENRAIQQEMVAGGSMVGFVPDGACSEYSEDRIRLIPITVPQFSRQLRVSFRRDKYLSPMAMAFKAHVLDTFGISEGDHLK